MAGRVISIEIGYSLTRICEMDYKTKFKKIYNSFTIPTMEGTINDGVLNLQPHYVEGLRKALVENGIKAKQVIFSISSAKIASREVVIPFVKENRIADVVQANASDYFPVDLSQYQLAYSVLETLGETKDKQQYKLLVLAAPTVMLNGYYELANALRLEVVGIEYVGNSLFQMVKSKCAQGSHLIIKMEESATLVMVVDNQKIAFVRNVSYGLDEAIQTIQNSLVWGEIRNVGQALDVASKNLCIDLGTAEQENPEAVQPTSPEDKIRAEVTAALMPLIGGIVRVIDYYVSRNSETPIENVFITGIGANIQGMDTLLAREINHGVTVIKEIDGFHLEKYFKTEYFGEYTTCIGAVIEPSGFKRHVDKSKKGAEGAKGSVNGMFVAWTIFGVGIFVAILLIGFSMFRYAGLAKTNAELRSQSAELEVIIPIYNEYVTTKNTYNQVTAMYEATENRNDGLYDFMFELEEKLPKNVSVVSFTSENETVTINMDVPTKEEAAAAIEQLRTFESLIPESVTVSSLVVEEDEENQSISVNFTVVAVYQPMDYEPETEAESETATETVAE